MKSLPVTLIVVSFIGCRNFDWETLQGKRPRTSAPIAAFTIPIPAYTPQQGLFPAAQNVAISSPVAGTTICYTTNGSQPECDQLTAACTTGAAYNAPLPIASTTTIRAVACKAGHMNSPVASGLFSIDLVAPAPVSSLAVNAGDGTAMLSWLNPADADFSRVKVVRKTLTAPADSADGNPVYEGAGSSFSDSGLVNGTTYYYAVFAYDLAGHESPATIGTVSPQGGLLNAPTYSPEPGLYNLPQSVTISSTNAGDIICFTSNGSTPSCDATPTCTTGTQVTANVAVAASQTLRAISCKNGSPASAVAPAAFTIDTAAPVFSGLLPANGAIINSTQLSYNLSESCVAGTVTWTRSGGSADAASPHASVLTASEMFAGSHTAISLVNNPALVQGAVYDIAFSCSDAAGNTSATASIVAVTYDAAPPAGLTAFRSIAGDGRITLVWNNPVDTDLAGVKIVRKTGSYPANNTDGTVIFNAMGTSTVDTPLTNGAQYYYRAFAFDSAGNFSSISSATASPFVPCGAGSCRIFVTSAQYDGNLGGITGADAKCNADAAKPNASTYRAILSDGITRIACATADCGGASGVEQSVDWPLFPGRTYVRADGTTPIGTANASAIFPIPSLTGPVQSSPATQVWTGLDSWTWHANNCQQWTTGNSGGNLGATGVANSGTVATAFWNTTGNCNGSRPLYCAEQ
ncbi:MAG: DUF1554 domain-containing protein [Spirochaetota bacterium]